MNYDNWTSTSISSIQAGQTDILHVLNMPPPARNGPIVVDTCADVDVIGPAHVSVILGVSNPSQTSLPMYPYCGVAHSPAEVIVPDGARQHVHVSRLDVVDSTLTPTPGIPITWTMNKSSNGAYPKLALSIQNLGSAAASVTNVSFKSVAMPVE